MAADDFTHHSVPEIVINRDGSEDRRVAVVDDYGGKIELNTQQRGWKQTTRRPAPNRSATR